MWELAQSYNLEINSYDDTNASKQLIKSTVVEKYTSDWLTKLQDVITNPILQTYDLFEKEFRWENYLSCVQNPQYHNALTKFRTSSHTLWIERGRHTNPVTPMKQRLCNVCQLSEDESHFLLQCNMFTDERTAFLLQIQNKYSKFTFLDNRKKIIFLLQNDDTQIITWTAKFIHHAMKKGIIGSITNYDQRLYAIATQSWCARLDTTHKSIKCSYTKFLFYLILFLCIVGTRLCVYIYICMCPWVRFMQMSIRVHTDTCMAFRSAWSF